MRSFHPSTLSGPCLLLSLLWPSATSSALDVSGTIAAGTTWSDDTVRITGDVTVANGVTLTVAPGVQVIAQGKYRLNVSGRLQAVGSAVDSIRFSPLSAGTGWYGIRFAGTAATNDSSLLDYCVVSGGMADGSGADGTAGGLLADGFAKVRVARSAFRGNGAHYGGAIYLANSANIVIHDCVFSTNQAFGQSTDGVGGAVYASNASPRITGCVFSSNAAITAGAICLRTSAALVQGNTIVDNRATGIRAQDYHGAGVYVQQSTARIEGNTIARNTAQRDGGGIYVIGSPQAVIARNVICNNGGRDGGGIFCQDGATAMVSNLIANNTAGTYGGGICLRNASAVILNATLANNMASEEGGGVAAINASNAILRSCILWGNQAVWGGDQGYVSGSTPGVTWSDVQGGQAAFATTGTWADNQQVAPQFTRASAAVGTAADGLAADWSLATGSPCINAGSTDTSGVGVADAYGAPRVVGGRIDMGALESGTTGARPGEGSAIRSVRPSGSPGSAVYDVMGRRSPVVGWHVGVGDRRSGGAAVRLPPIAGN